jgi:AmpD protein
MSIGGRGWLAGARRVASPNHDSRPPGCEPTLLVVHSISLPAGNYGGDEVERLFCNRLDSGEHPAFAELAGLRVSAHFFVRRDGELVRFVPLERRAWHAGASRWRGRSRCNDISIGVELEGVDSGPFEHAQYQRLTKLVRRLRARLPLREVAAHSDVAPGRKADPGARFDWARVLAELARA